jgi:hypothetical protein
MIAYIQRNLRIKGETSVSYYNCRLCPNPLWTEKERANGFCSTCLDKAIELKPTPHKKRPMSFTPRKIKRLNDEAMQSRIDAIVNRNKAGAV